MPHDKILCVAEKPSIARAVAGHLSGGQINTRSISGTAYVKNYDFHFNFGAPWGYSSVTMTSVIGHLTNVEFDPAFKSWKSCDPVRLFDERIFNTVDDDKKGIAENITREARQARALFIWTDNDREGEHIGAEVRQAAQKGNPRILVKRARFNNTERTSVLPWRASMMCSGDVLHMLTSSRHIVQAAAAPIDLDEKQVNAVAARIELDLRIGAAFTRFQTLLLQPLGGALAERVMSYGSCQFPTLGFVVDRYFRVQNFVPEKFWSIRVMHRREDKNVTFHWDRGHLFDRMAVTILFERCLDARFARVSQVQTRPTSKWKPLPLTTVQLQRLGSMLLRIDSQRIMKIAEDLYTNGWISYPRTETDQFDASIDLRPLIQKQVHDHRWGSYAQSLLDGAFVPPRAGQNNDQAHPPIHPVNHVAPEALSADEARVYEFITRRFLGCCSADAQGSLTTLSITLGQESFRTSGLMVLARNYLDIYTYDHWQSSQPLPTFNRDETFEPTEAKMTDGQTSKPGYLTEPDLIALMDANGIGTDATMAEHIAKIKERNYVIVRPCGSTSTRAASPAPQAQGNRGNRGRRGRGGSNGAPTTRGTVGEFIPTTLGTALIVGYDSLNLETSLGKPFLRKEMELRMREICAGTRTKDDVVRETLDLYRGFYVRVAGDRGRGKLIEACRRYVVNSEVS